MFELNFTKLTKLLFWALLFLVTGCTQKWESNHANIFTPAPIVANNSAVAVKTNIRKSPVQSDFANSKTKKQFQSIWPRIFNQFALPVYDNPRIDKQVRHLLRDPKFLINVQKRAEPYLHFIIEEVEAKQIPGELVLLPIIESAFKTHAYSRSRASGLWQFIPATGRFFGMKQNWWYDGRRDIYASTNAATRYLKELAELFDGDWLLALASYNAGKGNVAKAIKRNQRLGLATDYWSLRLPRETMAYVPRLLAVARIFANADKYNLALRTIANKPVFTVVNIGSQLDLIKAAKLADISTGQLMRLNPGFNRWYTDPKGPHRLLIPIDKANVFRQRLAKLPDSERLQWQRHKVRPGDNLAQIAKKFGSSVNAIRQINRLTSNRIYAGNYLLIPARNQSINKPRNVIASLIPNRKIYRVRKGDSVWSIARKFSVSTQNLMHWNKLNKKSILRLGQKLLLVPAKTKTAAASGNPFRLASYTVRKGDSLALISRKFNISIHSLRKWNRLGKYLQPGQQLKIAVAGQPAT